MCGATTRQDAGGARWSCAAAIFAGSSMAWTGIPVAANAAEATDQKHYVIPAQPLTQALAEFARVSGVDIFYEAGLASGHRSAAIDGRYTPATALRALLAGTGLSARFTGRTAALVFSPDRKRQRLKSSK